MTRSTDLSCLVEHRLIRTMTKITSKKALSTHDHRMNVQVGDLIKWRDAFYGFGYTGQDYHYHVPRYGIVVEIRQLSQEDYEFWLGSKTAGYPYHGDDYIYEMFWIKVLTMGDNRRGAYIYLDIDDDFQIISKVKDKLNAKD